MSALVRLYSLALSQDQRTEETGNRAEIGKKAIAYQQWEAGDTREPFPINNWWKIPETTRRDKKGGRSVTQQDSEEIVKKLLDDSLPGLPHFGWPPVDVRDIADLHVRAMVRPEAAGERFIGAGPFY